MLNGMREGLGSGVGGGPFFVLQPGQAGRKRALGGQGLKKRHGEEREGLDTAISI